MLQQKGHMSNFMRWRWVYFVISLFVILPGLYSLVTHGLHLAIDFTGGTLLEVRLQETKVENLTVAALPDQIKTIFPDLRLQTADNNQVILRGKTIDDAARAEVIASLETAYGVVTPLRFETVGPVIGRELVVKTLVAMVLAATIITIYIARQFKELKYGVCAVLAMFHDILVILGVFSLLGWIAGVEVDVLFVTALLTTLSFSVHDTIVVFDRIRELQLNHPRLEYRQVVNAAVLQTLSRSLNNSITIILMLLALVLLGGDSIRWFAMALLVGAVTGTYSSTFTAVPLLLTWEELKRRINR